MCSLRWHYFTRRVINKQTDVVEEKKNREQNPHIKAMRYCLVCARSSIKAHALAMKNVPATRAEMTTTTKAANIFFVQWNFVVPEPGKMKNDHEKRCEEGKNTQKNENVNISIWHKYINVVSGEHWRVLSFVGCKPYAVHSPTVRMLNEMMTCRKCFFSFFLCWLIVW